MIKVCREPCCGTHVDNTKELKQFCVTNVKSLGRGTVSITCLTGNRAENALRNADELREHVELLNRSISDNIDKVLLLFFLLKRRFI